MSNRYKYGDEIAEVSDADGVSGLLITTTEGYALRVEDSSQPDGFSDFLLRHDDLRITIDKDSLASFYTIGGEQILDHSPSVLGLSEVKNG